MFIVHYYQPYDMGFDVHVNFSVSGQTNPGGFYGIIVLKFQEESYRL